MEQVINSNTVYDFFKLLVEFGGAYYVDNQQVINCTSDNSPVGVAVGKKTLPVVLFKEGMKVGKYVPLNPLIESCNKAPEREWFFQTRQLIIGGLIQRLFKKVVEIAISKDKDASYDKLELVTAYLDKLDEKMLKEIDRIKLMQWAYLYYDRSTHTAQLQTDINNPTLQEELGNKVRKQTWEVLRGMMAIVFGTEDIEGTYQHVSTVVACPKADAIFQVLAKVAVKLNPHVKKLLDIDLHPQIFAGHLEHIEKYQKLVGWFASGTGTVSEVAKQQPAIATPWTTGAKTDVAAAIGGPKFQAPGYRNLLPTTLSAPGVVVPQPVGITVDVPQLRAPQQQLIHHSPTGYVPAPMVGYHMGAPTGVGLLPALSAPGAKRW